MTPEELALEQIALLRQQNKLLLNIATHTRLLHVVAWVSLVGFVLAAAISAGSGSDAPGPAIVVLLLGGCLLAAVAFGVKNIEKEREEPAAMSTAPTS